MKLELRGVTKRFPGIVANDSIDLVIEPGEIHALLGENGAGKTTLVNVLYGLYRADDGEILIDDRPVVFHSPGDAIAAGLGMVHQHFMLIPVFTVTENIMLGVETTRGGLGFLDQRKAGEQVRELGERFGLEVPPDGIIEELPVGIQQRVEILKALYREAQVLILDEPTAVLTPQEIDELFVVMRSLRADGKSIIFISHKLKEVLAISDRITVLRRGKVVGSAKPKETTEEGLAAMMVGRAVQLRVDRAPANPKEPVLQIENLVVFDERGHRAVDGVGLDVRAGEIVCVAGVQGNGQTELVEALMGLRPVTAGTIRIGGKDTTHSLPDEVLSSGVGHVPEDRIQDGLIADFSIADNLVLNTFDEPPFAHWIVRDEDAVAKAAHQRVEAFDIRTTSVRAPVSTLSGGNQQKVVVAREFSRPIRLLVASQPTRGLDVGSIEYIHEQLVSRRDQGAAVVVVSSELDEVMGLGDRIAVMYRGQIVAVEEGDQATREQLGLLMAGSVEAATHTDEPSRPEEPSDSTEPSETGERDEPDQRPEPTEASDG